MDIPNKNKIFKLANGICKSDKISTETQIFRNDLQHDSPYPDWIQIIQDKGVEWEPLYKCNFFVALILKRTYT